MIINLKNMTTEQNNSNSYDIDRVDTLSMLKIINKEDNYLVERVGDHLAELAKMIDIIYDKTKTNGRIVYIGAGTSGRLGVLDASEILPTFGVGDLFYGLIAGGDVALRNPVEGSEDSKSGAAADLKKMNFQKNDVLIGIAASGRTPYVIGAIEYAKQQGAMTFGICMNENTPIKAIADMTAEIAVGPEVITGSTRMKAGSATKLVLNMISTCIMIKRGKVYHNWMVDLKATNQKLQSRCFNMVKKIAKCDDEQLVWKCLEDTEFNTVLAIIMLVKKVSSTKAQELLEANEYMLGKIIG